MEKEIAKEMEKDNYNELVDNLKQFGDSNSSTFNKMWSMKRIFLPKIKTTKNVAKKNSGFLHNELSSNARFNQKNICDK